MTSIDPNAIAAAEIVLPCAELDLTLGFFTELGFRVETIFPADAPEVAVILGHGVRLRLQRGNGAPGTLRLRTHGPEAPRVLTAPNGTRVELVPAEAPIAMPALEPRFVLTRVGQDWGTGRAGMRYRDLIPGRLGGRFIASHIEIPDGGPVPDYVHYHQVRFQMIFCRAGWVRVVYEDQGEPFIMRAGDCVLQPPRIRHRVLESSAGLEVIEIGCPALHETWADHALALPTGRVDPARDFGGQRFVRHVAAESAWVPWRDSGFEMRDTGIGAATDGLAGARVVRPRGANATPSVTHDAEFLFAFVLSGSATLDCGGAHRLAPGDSYVIPACLPFALADCSGNLELLEVTLPATIQTRVGPAGRG